jgi:hypothetical protein
MIWQSRSLLAVVVQCSCTNFLGRVEQTLVSCSCGRKSVADRGCWGSQALPQVLCPAAPANKSDAPVLVRHVQGFEPLVIADGIKGA